MLHGRGCAVLHASWRPLLSGADRSFDTNRPATRGDLGWLAEPGAHRAIHRLVGFPAVHLARGSTASPLRVAPARRRWFRGHAHHERSAGMVQSESRGRRRPVGSVEVALPRRAPDWSRCQPARSSPRRPGCPCRASIRSATGDASPVHPTGFPFCGFCGFCGKGKHLCSAATHAGCRTQTP